MAKRFQSQEFVTDSKISPASNLNKKLYLPGMMEGVEPDYYRSSLQVSTDSSREQVVEDKINFNMTPVMRKRQVYDRYSSPMIVTKAKTKLFSQT